MQIKLSNLSEQVSAPYGLVKQIMGIDRQPQIKNITKIDWLTC